MQTDDLCGSFESRDLWQRKTHRTLSGTQGYRGRSRDPNIAGGRKAGAGKEK